LIADYFSLSLFIHVLRRAAAPRKAPLEAVA
jgi:hypothetical protein